MTTPALHPDTGRPFPVTLYHYTDARGLQGIVETGQLWASSARHLNDFREFVLTLDAFDTYLAARLARSDSSPGARGMVERFIADIANIRANETTFIACFSEWGDDLSQWRAYGREGGYAIGFSTRALFDHAAQHGFYGGPCIYDEDHQRILVSESVEARIGMHEANPEHTARNPRLSTPAAREEATRQDFEFWARSFPERVIQVASAIKHPAFRHENEWRLVRLPPVRAVEAHRIRGPFLVPYQTIPIRRHPAGPPITEIIIGPSMDKELAARGARSLLARHGLDPAIVRESEVPYRTY